MFVYQYVVFHKDQSKVHIFTRTKPLMVIATENTHDTVMNNGITPDNMKTKLKDKAKINESVINVCVSVCGDPQGSIQGPHFHQDQALDDQSHREHPRYCHEQRHHSRQHEDKTER